jgi:hypothetical protein
MMHLLEPSRSRRRELAIALSLALLAPAAMPFDRTPPRTQAPDPAAAAAARTPASRAPQALGPEEAAELAQRAEEPGPEVAGGALSNEHLTYIVIALGAAVLVLIAK